MTTSGTWQLIDNNLMLRSATVSFGRINEGGQGLSPEITAAHEQGLSKRAAAPPERGRLAIHSLSAS